MQMFSQKVWAVTEDFVKETYQSKKAVISPMKSPWHKHNPSALPPTNDAATINEEPGQ